MPNLREKLSGLPKTIGVRKFTRNLAQIKKELQEGKQPLLVTSHSEPQMLVMSPQLYEGFLDVLRELHDTELYWKMKEKYKNQEFSDWEEVKKRIPQP